MQIGAMNHPARPPLDEIEWIGTNGFDFVDLTLENIAAIMERVRLLRFHLDSGHAKLERGQDRWNEYLERLAPKLLHVHLSENDGTADQHLPLASAPRSSTNWPKLIKSLKATGYDGTITLEVFSPEKAYLLMSRDLLKKWWDR